MRQRFVWCWLVLVLANVSLKSPATTVRASYGISFQVNVSAAGTNILGDAANEPSMCIDPNDPNRMAIGWRQFDTVTNSFRQAAWAYSTNGGLNWVFPSVLEPGTFRSDPVLASDADGVFYYLGVLTNGGVYHCDLWTSTNGGSSWVYVGESQGGDKQWMAIDTTSGSGRGNIYELWSPYYNFANDFNAIFSRSTDGGLSWMPPITMANWPHFGTVDVGPNGEVYTVGIGVDEQTFWVNRSTNAPNAAVPLAFDLTAPVDLGGPYIFGSPINPDGLLGQAWIAVDRSDTPRRGNVYVLCTVTNDPGNLANVMFSRSADGGLTWSPPVRINDDSPVQHAWHWLGTLGVASNGRIDACWYDTRHDPTNRLSELYYSWSEDGGLTWAANEALSPPFDASIGYPMQEKMGDYMSMISLNDNACIAYAATFNGEEDVYFVRAERPITASVLNLGKSVRISWNAVPGASYAIQAQSSLAADWASALIVDSLVSTGSVGTIERPVAQTPSARFYRVVRQP